MKQTLSTGQAADLLFADQYANWSYKGARALVEYLEDYEESTDTEMELDVVALRCEFDEYPSALDAALEYGFEPDSEQDDEEQANAAFDWLQDRTTVIEFDGGVILEVF